MKGSSLHTGKASFKAKNICPNEFCPRLKVLPNQPTVPISSNAVTTSQSGESAQDAERLPLNTEISAIPLDSSAANTLTADTLATDAKSALKLLRIRNVGRVIIGYLNINSVRNKFDALKEIVAQVWMY